MLKRLDVESRLDLAIFLSLILLVAISPLGNEATHPIVLGSYRTLLLILILASIFRARQFQLPQISFLFMGAAGLGVLAMYASAVLRTGSHFEGVANFYRDALFMAAFIGVFIFPQ